MKKVKIITIALIVAIIAMVAFVGIYLPKEKSNTMENIVKGYSFAPDVYGQRHIRLEISDENEEVKKESNYAEVKSILEKRLDKLVAEEYTVALNKSTGTIDIDVAENDYTDEILGVIVQDGVFEIIDTNTKEVLMNNNDLKDINISYGRVNEVSEAQSVSVEYKFTEEGAKKLEEITNKYVPVEEVETTDETEETEKVENKVTMLFNGQTVLETDFETPISTGSLYLSMGSPTTDTTELNKTLKEAGKLKLVLDAGEFPVEYKLADNTLILGNINAEEILNIAIGSIILIGAIILIVKFRTTGIFGTILLIGSMSTYILALKLTNVQISVNAMFVIPVIGIINLGIIAKTIKEIRLAEEKPDKIIQRVNGVIKDSILFVVPLFVISTAFTFAKMSTVNSFGMTMFWGLIVTIAFIIIYTKALKMKEAKNAK